MNRFRLISLSFMLCLSVGMLHCPVEADSENSSSSSSNTDGTGDGSGGDGGGGGDSDSVSVDDIGLTWSGWGAGSQPFPTKITCTTSGNASQATITMGGTGLDPIEYDLYDNGTNGDTTAGDGVFTIEFVQDLGVNALWAVDNVGHYLTCDAENNSSSDDNTWYTAGEVVIDNNTASTHFDTLFIARPSASSWGGDLMTSILSPGGTYTVTDVPCGIWDLRIESTGGGSAETYNEVVTCGGTFTWVQE